MKRLLCAACGVCAIGGCVPVSTPVEPVAVVPVEIEQVIEPPPTAEPIWFPEPVVEEEFLSMRGNGRYRVGDMYFKPWRRVDRYEAVGMATWRDERFDERVALTGEPFDNEALTAAHRHLPIPSYVRVTNLANDVQTTVRITDRGPFRTAELIDLSRAAALRLGFGDVDARPVRVELISQPGPRLVLETNYMYGESAAQAVVEQLQALELGHIRTQVIPHQYENRFRVKIGSFASVEDANRIASWLSSQLQLESSLLKE